jgi:bacterioferritin
MRAALLCHDSSTEATWREEQRQAQGCSPQDRDEHRLQISRFIRSFMRDIFAWERAMNDSKAQPFVSDMKEIQRRAREHVEKGAVTPAYRGDVQTAVKLLNEALATEIVCVLRYRRHHFMASGIHYQSVADEFMEHAQEEQQHADRIAERIRQLGGAPDFNPQGLLARSHSQYAEGQSLMDMIKEDLIAERIAIESYLELIRFFGDNDPTSRRLMEEVLQQEEEHADDMATLMETLDAREPISPRAAKR